MLKNLLVATDGSEGSVTAARLASRLAAPHGQMLLLNVQPQLGEAALNALDALNLAVGGVRGGFAQEWRQKAEREGTELLERTRKQLAATTPSTVEIHTELETGRPATAILERLEHGAFDGLVIGSRSRNVITHALLGSVATEAMIYATKPVLTSRRDQIRRILLATDGSPASVHAAEAAGQLARDLGATVTVLSAWEFPIDTIGEQREFVETALHSKFRESLTDVRRALGVEPRESKLVFHEPVHAILTEAARDDIDLIVLGRRRHHPGTLTRIGSVAYRVAMTSPTSVLVVP
jgi:nucleotide-binding universal stress UspA family protein